MSLERNFAGWEANTCRHFTTYGKFIPDLSSSDPMRTVIFLFCGY